MVGVDLPSGMLAEEDVYDEEAEENMSLIPPNRLACFAGVAI